MGRSLVQKSSTGFDVSECDLENSIRRSTSPNRDCCAMQKGYTAVFRWDIPVCGEYNLIQLTVKHTK